MPGLFGIFEVGRNSLVAMQAAIHTVGHNVANAGTTGFHRQRVNLSPTLPELTAFGALGTGVRIDQVQRVEDRFLEMAVQRELPILARYGARANALAQSQLAFGEPSDHGLTSILEEFYTAWDDLASSPEDQGARESVVRLGVTLADSINNSRARLFDQQASLTAEVSQSLDEANRVIRELEQLNRNILVATRGEHVPADLEDRRDVLVETLSDLVGASASVEADGTATVRIAGRVIVQLETSQEIGLDQETMVPRIEGSTFRPGEIHGRIGGLLDTRDGDLAVTIQRLDEFALNLAEEVNSVHTQGLTAHGTPALPFFVLEGLDRDGVTGAARGLRVATELRNDPSLVAAGATGAPGDNSIALDIAALRHDRFGAAARLRSLVVDLGARAREAEDLALGQQIIVNGFLAQRESISGVSLDEEAANLMRFQRSFQAAAQIMTVVDEMAQSVLAM